MMRRHMRRLDVGQVAEPKPPVPKDGEPTPPEADDEIGIRVDRHGRVWVCIDGLGQEVGE